MQWGESSFTPSAATLVQSTGGNNFDGAVLGSSVVMFMRAWPATFTGVTYPASGGTTQYVSDLTPNATYSVTGAGTPSSVTADAAGVLVFSASGTGNISIASGTGLSGKHRCYPLIFFAGGWEHTAIYGDLHVFGWIERKLQRHSDLDIQRSQCGDRQ